MKAMALLPAVAAAILALSISAASSQQAACMKEFQACMDGCASRSSKSIQDSCFHSCEGKNTLCAEHVYGKRPFNGVPSTAASTGPKDALARNEPAADPRDQSAPRQTAPEPTRQRSRTQHPRR